MNNLKFDRITFLQALESVHVDGRIVNEHIRSTVLADENYLRESILNPPARIVASYAPLMPSFRGQLSDEQVDHLITYIKSLASAAPNSDAAGPTSRPANSTPFNQLPNVPPARGQTDYDRRIGNDHQP